MTEDQKWRKARKKPVDIKYREPKEEKEEIETREGTVVAKKGEDYVIEGVEGEIYPIGKDIFEQSYERLDEDNRSHLVDTAHVKWVSGDHHAVSLTEIMTDEDGTWIQIPDFFVDRDYLGLEDQDVEIYHNADNFVSIGQSTGHGVAEATVKREEHTTYLKVGEEMDAIKPLNNANHFPVLFLGCGEMWIMNNQDLWNKLAAEVEE